VDLTIATDGSVLFGVGYHSWILTTETEDILLAEGGPDDCQGKYMTSYRSELGGIIAGLAVLGTLLWSGLINARRIKFICDNSAAILASKRELTQSIFHRKEGDHDLIATIKYLQHKWYNNTEVTYAWVKGHEDREDQDPNREEQLNTEVDALCDLIREEARGPRGTRPSCPHWDLEVCSLFIKGDKVTSKMKPQMENQRHDKDMRKYLTEREIWTENQFDKVDWTSYKTAFKRMGRSRQTSISKVCHSMCHTGVRHTFYYHDPRPCCICGEKNKDWRHVMTCRSLDASLHRADSWEKVKKDMEIWQRPNEFWTAVQKGLQFYINHPLRRVKEDSPKPTPKPVSPFPHGFNQPRSLLRKAYRTQSNIGWENFTKGRITRHWQNYINHHLQNKNIKLPKDEWAAKLIIALWEHLRRVWKFRNGVYHAEKNRRISRYKLEAQSRAMSNTWERHKELQRRLKKFQHQHFDDHDQIANLHYDSKQCWIGLTKLFLDKSESVTPVEKIPLA
jgi:hypothetical protein